MQSYIVVVERLVLVTLSWTFQNLTLFPAKTSMLGTCITDACLPFLISSISMSLSVS